jgi:hypothetical protein
MWRHHHHRLTFFFLFISSFDTPTSSKALSFLCSPEDIRIGAFGGPYTRQNPGNRPHRKPEREEEKKKSLISFVEDWLFD